jgi:hypothetical protein
MSEWLDLMLEEIDRKQQETSAAREEAARRSGRQEEGGPSNGTGDADPAIDSNP